LLYIRGKETWRDCHIFFTTLSQDNVLKLSVVYFEELQCFMAAGNRRMAS